MIAREVRSSALAAVALPIDITPGNNNGFEAGPGWDPMAGLGLPKGDAIATPVGGVSAFLKRPDQTGASRPRVRSGVGCGCPS